MGAWKQILIQFFPFMKLHSSGKNGLQIMQNNSLNIFRLITTVFMKKVLILDKPKSVVDEYIDRYRDFYMQMYTDTGLWNESDSDIILYTI